MLKRHTDSNLKKDIVREKQTEPFTIEELTKLWYKFPQKIAEVTQIHFIFHKQPVLLDDNTIRIEVSSKIVESQLREIFPILREYLWSSLKNETIKLDVLVKENPKLAVLSTPKDKARFLADKNPRLRNLFKELNLEFK